MTIETRPSAAHRIATELAAENKRLRAENSGLSQMLAGQRIDLAQSHAHTRHGSGW